MNAVLNELSTSQIVANWCKPVTLQLYIYIIYKFATSETGSDILGVINYAMASSSCALLQFRHCRE